MGRQSFVTVLVGPCALLREGLGRILSAADFRITATAASVEDLIASQQAEDRPNLLILEVSRDQTTTVKQIKVFRGQYPTARIALLADREQLVYANIVSAFRSGADAYFLKPSCEAFIKSLDLVMIGEVILPPSILSLMLHEDRSIAAGEVKTEAGIQRAPIAYAETSSTDCPRLSERERRILRCLIEGDSNKAIARKNDMADATVKAHIKAILHKIRVNNRTKAAIWALNHGSLIGGTSNDEALDPANGRRDLSPPDSSAGANPLRAARSPSRAQMAAISG
jgi:two-component system nitrate/nitrite response regulator NarL